MNKQRRLQQTTKQKRLQRSADSFLESHGYGNNGLRESNPGTLAVGMKKIRLNREATDLHTRFISEGSQYRMTFEQFQKMSRHAA